MSPERLLQEPALQFGGITFFARPHESESCGSNGLPLTPNSITIYGQAQILKSIEHLNLCQYLDIIRSKHERIIVVSQLWGKSLESAVKDGSFQTDSKDILHIAYQIINALNHLHQKNIVHRNLAPNNILINDKNVVKLFNYGLYYMTGNGRYVSFPIGEPKYMAPETLLAGPNGPSLGPKPDIWSLGIILVELVLKQIIWKDLKLPQILRKILSLTESNGSIFERIAREHNCLDLYQNLTTDIKELIEMCLKVNGNQRPTSKDLITYAHFKQFITEENILESKKKLCAPFTIVELYYWWQLAGGDIYSVLKKEGLILNKPPILNIPKIMLLEGPIYGQKRREEALLDLRVVPVNLNPLYKRFYHIPLKCYFPLIYCKSETIHRFEPEPYDAAQLPLIIREKDPEYQFHRVILFKRLLKGYPSTRELIAQEAQKDVPPLLRGDIWAALLNVGGNYTNNYIRIDKETSIPTDRQIEVDIPRCHQYNELLSSSEGHKKLKRILKAWIVCNPEYVYWQGLDSLTAPFLYLNFNNEARAFACLSEFIPRYLHKFFLKDNSLVIQEYLAKFSQIIAFNDPELANHLNSINFIPELFAIPWFLTIFSHVFPLHKILHLWDKLILGDSSFPLYIGLAVLHQLRDTLLSSGFNECILLFSDLPEVDIEVCVSHSVEKYSLTPKSITLRQYQSGDLNAKSELDISSVDLAGLKKEICPRISAADLVRLLRNSPEQVIVVDIRSPQQFKQAAVTNSLNIPFVGVQLDDPNIESLGSQGAKLIDDMYHIIVVIGSDHSHAQLFSKYLVQCAVKRVCILHGGINVLYTVTPTILVSETI